MAGEFQDNDPRIQSTCHQDNDRRSVKCVRSQSNVGEKIYNCHRILDFCLSLTDCLKHTGSPIGNGRELTGIIVNLGIVKDMDFKGISLGLP